MSTAQWSVADLLSAISAGRAAVDQHLRKRFMSWKVPIASIIGTIYRLTLCGAPIALHQNTHSYII